ncbi:MAG: serine/threonine-protein kinase [Bryobacteraceae bacterium]
MSAADRWLALQQLYHAALELPEEERAAFAARECANDAEMQRELESLLAHEVEGTADFLDRPAVEVAARELMAGESEAAMEPGTQLGPYKILEQIARGGMGVVYRAEQQYPVRRVVALKVIKPGMDTVEVVARFNSERQALAVMDHPAIAKVFDAGSTPQGRPYFVMEYVVGTSILDYCAERKLTVPQRLQLFIGVCEGVQHAHYKSIVHRDLKPSNILVVEVDGKPSPKIIDFGIAKALHERPASGTFASLTSAGAIVGTPHYMSLEQAEGADLDTRTDVYSLGVVLYELLVGALPLDFAKTPAHQFAEKLRDEDAPRPSTKVRTLGGEAGRHAENLGADVPALSRKLRGDLDAIILKALEKDRNRRYASPADFAADLGRYLRFEPVLARPAGMVYRTGRYLRRHRIAASVGAFTLALLVVAAVAQRRELEKTRRERDRADRVTQFMTRMFEVSNPSEARGNEVRAREILDKAAQEMDKELTSDPPLRAQMMHVMGRVYQNLGLYAKSEKLLRQALDVRLRTLGADHPDTLQSMGNLGVVLEAETRFPEAEKLLRETAERRGVVLGEAHRDTLGANTSLAAVLDSQGRYQEAETLNREVLQVARIKLGSADPLVLSVLRNLAVDLAYQGRFTESEKAFREVLELGRRAFGEDHPRVLLGISNLGAVVQNQGRYAEAEGLYLEAIARSRKVLGPKHSTTLMTMGNLGQVLGKEGRNAEAAKLYREVYEAKRKTLGPENRSTLVTAGNLAGVLTNIGQLGEAEQIVMETLPTIQRVMGPRHSDTLIILEELGNIRKRQGRLGEAEELRRQLLDLRRQTLGMKHTHTALSYYNLARVLALVGKREEAIAHLRTAVELPLLENERKALEKESDFQSLHGDPRFSEILTISRQRLAGEKRPK